MLIPTCMIKFMELTLAVACLTLHHYSFDLTDIPTLMLCSGTYVGYVIVFSGEIVGEMLFAPLDLVQDIYYGIIGMGLYGICGCMLLIGRLRESAVPRTGDPIAAMILGAVSVLTAIVMFLDLTLAYLDSEEFDDEYNLYVVGEIVSAVADAYVDAWWSASGGALFAGCGYLTLRCWKDVPDCMRRTYAQAAAACALALSALLILDAILAICSAHRDDTSSRLPKPKPC